jgi:hypothetical protein
VRLLLVCLLATVAAAAAEPPLVPLRVCEILDDLHVHEGQTLLVLGRFSFREQGRFLSEQACQAKVVTAGVSVAAISPPKALRIVIDPKSGPKPPERLAVDAAVLDRKLSVVKQATTLAIFRFASTDYDRWAVVYGRVEAEPPQDKPRKGEFEPALARIVCRGEALVIFLADRRD